MYKPAIPDPSTSPLPQTAFGEGPEVDHRPRYHLPVPEQQQQQPALSPPEPISDKNILGLRRQTFWLGLILLVVVIAAAVGGGVGGFLAVQKAKSKADTLAQATKTLTVCPASTRTNAPPLTNSPSSLTSTPTSTPSSSASGSIYTPLPPSAVARVDNTCPQSGNLSLTGLGQTSSFACIPKTDYPGNDITGLVAYTMQQCLESCLLANYVQGGRVCVAVAYSEQLSEQYERVFANCFLKDSVVSQGVDEN